ncbi:response regulator [Phenylobacterium montanum]|nr:response regulator [Caulobacter sp. S6]
MSMVAEARPKRVLVVDDEPLMVDLITTRLEVSGYQTFYARNGRGGLERLAETRPDALVLDINMPVMDGFKVLEQMKASGLLAKTPTMVLTARNQAADVKRAISLGARDFLTKPFEDQTLLLRVARLLRPPRSAPASNPETGSQSQLI